MQVFVETCAKSHVKPFRIVTGATLEIKKLVLLLNLSSVQIKLSLAVMRTFQHYRFEKIKEFYFYPTISVKVFQVSTALKSKNEWNSTIFLFSRFSCFECEQMFFEDHQTRMFQVPQTSYRSFPVWQLHWNYPRRNIF